MSGLSGTTVIALTVGGLLVYYVLSPSESKKTKMISHASLELKDHLTINELDTRRVFALANGKATDHFSDVVIVPNADFNLDKTIFASLEGTLPRLLYKVIYVYIYICV